ncbi:uncharacterized protein [Ranitomeya imitator]|uniref:uncharacterized protein isoform X2 n=1 Tax=Ranitomeya imitator TaxID=111125 RepID=UPI0037E90096
MYINRLQGSHRFQKAEPEVDLFPAVICRLSVNVWEDDMAMALRILGLTAVYSSGLVILAAVHLSSGEVYVRRGSNITDCSMKCPHTDGVLQLYRDCGGEETPLLELWCDNKWHYNRYKPRLLYNNSTGCWSLRDAGKNDSCVYNVVYYGDNGRFLTTLHITVLDPVLISNITSNSSRKGEDIAVSVQFSGEGTAVTWEVDEGLLPDRYRLTDDNRTVIIPKAPRDDIGRRFRVRITNPVSEATGEHQLEITDFPVVGVLVPVVGVLVAVLIVFAVLFLVSRCWAISWINIRYNSVEETRDLLDL